MIKGVFIKDSAYKIISWQGSYKTLIYTN